MNWCRNIVIVVLVISTLSGSFLVPLIHLDFELRRDYIEKVLCIERDQPIAVCKGSCVLNSRLDLATDHDQQEQKPAPIEISFFFHSHLTEELSPQLHVASKGEVLYYAGTYDPHLIPVFQPPGV